MALITKVEFQEWKQNPVTKEFLEYLKEYKESLVRSSTLRQTADLTLKETAFKEGCIATIDSMIAVDFTEE